jgi:alpha-L-arabinofuranosidase
LKGKSNLFILGLVIGGFIFSALCGIALSLYWERDNLRNTAKNLYLLFRKSDKNTVDIPIEKDFIPGQQTVINIEPDIVIGKVSPFLYGVNLSPKMETRPDIIQLCKSLGITFFRFPGTSGYHWKNGTFDFDQRCANAPLRNIDYLIAFCKLTNTQLVLQVNIESATAQEAAEWVEYMNKKAGFPVKYWEIGNEVYGDWDKAYMKPEEYAAVIKEFAGAMKTVDPTIKIGMDWAFSHKDNFNKAVLKEAGEYIDFISYHWYPNLTKFSKPFHGRIHPTPKEVMANSLEIPRFMQHVKELIAANCPQKKDKIELTFLEWDGAVDAPASDFPPYSQGMIQWSLANAIFYADTLGMFAASGATVASSYDLQSIGFGFIRGWDENAGWGGQPWDGETLRPKALALKLFAQHFGDTLIKNTLENIPYYYKEKDWWPDSYSGNVPYISCYASKHSQKNTLAIVLINKDEKRDYKVRLNIVSVKPEKQGKLIVLNGPELTAQNDGNPMNVQLKEFTVENINNSFTYTLPAHSVNLIEVNYST